MYLWVWVIHMRCMRTLNWIKKWNVILIKHKHINLACICTRTRRQRHKTITCAGCICVWFNDAVNKLMYRLLLLLLSVSQRWLFPLARFNSQYPVARMHKKQHKSQMVYVCVCREGKSDWKEKTAQKYTEHTVFLLIRKSFFMRFPYFLPRFFLVAFDRDHRQNCCTTIVSLVFTYALARRRKKSSKKKNTAQTCCW